MNPIRYKDGTEVKMGIELGHGYFSLSKRGGVWSTCQKSPNLMSEWSVTAFAGSVSNLTMADLVVSGLNHLQIS